MHRLKLKLVCSSRRPAHLTEQDCYIILLAAQASPGIVSHLADEVEDELIALGYWDCAEVTARGCVFLDTFEQQAIS